MFPLKKWLLKATQDLLRESLLRNVFSDPVPCTPTLLVATHLFLGQGTRDEDSSQHLSHCIAESCMTACFLLENSNCSTTFCGSLFCYHSEHKSPSRIFILSSWDCIIWFISMMTLARLLRSLLWVCRLSSRYLLCLILKAGPCPWLWDVMH
jgi:hypothetical protein